MNKIKHIFHLISYLQYPLMLIALFYTFKSVVLENKETLFVSFNTALIFIGIAISFSTLQDTTKTQNNLSKRMYESRKKGIIFLIYLTILIFLCIMFGLIGYFSKLKELKEISLGLIVLGIGIIGMLKAAIEMYENHRKD